MSIFGIEIAPKAEYELTVFEKKQFKNVVFGMLGMMVVFNLILASINADRVQFFLLCNLTPSALFFLTFNGLWPFETLPPFWLHVIRYADFFFGGLGLGLFHFFFSDYLQLKKHFPMVGRVVNSIGFLIIVNMLVGLFTHYYLASRFQNILALFTIVATFAVSWVMVKRKYKPALYMLLALLVSLVGLFLFILAGMGILGFNAWTSNVLYIGESIRAMVFAVGISVRFNMLKRELAEKELEKQRLISQQEREINQILESQNQLLIQRIGERTSELQEEKLKLETVNQVKDRLFSIIAHDLRGPLSALKGLLLLISMGMLEKEQLTNLARDVEGKVSDTINLVDNLLHWARSQLQGFTLQATQFSLRQSSELVLKVLGMEAEKKHILIENLITEEVECMADQQMMELVMRNLVSNAIKFTPSGGVIKLSAGKMENFVFFEVSDTGKGIAPEVISQLFDSKTYYTTQGTHHEVGTGLGLILCKEFVDKNRGIIEVESVEGKGSIFRIKLPDN